MPIIGMLRYQAECMVNLICETVFTSSVHVLVILQPSVSMSGIINLKFLIMFKLTFLQGIMILSNFSLAFLPSVFYGEMSTPTFFPLYIRVFLYLSLSFENVLAILNTSHIIIL